MCVRETLTLTLCVCERERERKKGRQTDGQTETSRQTAKQRDSFCLQKGDRTVKARYQLIV